MPQARKSRIAGIALIIAGLVIGASLLYFMVGVKLQKQYWATSLTETVDDNVLNGLYVAVRRGEVGWLDVDPKFPLPRLIPGINLILYHVGGNCYIGTDCNRFPSSEPSRDRWGDTEHTIDLNDIAARQIVIEDLVTIVEQGDKVTPEVSIVGVHLDNVHRLTAEGLAEVFNGFLKAVVYVSEDMTARMTQMPNISGAAWSADEGRYHPTVFIQGTAVPNARLPFGYCPLSMTTLFKESLNSALSHLSACLLFSRSASARTRRWSLLFLRIDAGAKRIHQVDHARRSDFPSWFDFLGATKSGNPNFCAISAKHKARFSDLDLDAAEMHFAMMIRAESQDVRSGQ